MNGTPKLQKILYKTCNKKCGVLSLGTVKNKFSAGEVERLEMPKLMPNHAELCDAEHEACTFFALCQKMPLCNLLIIRCDLI